MKKNFFTLGLLLSALLLMVSCSKTPEHLKLIPKDVTAVASIDFKQIAKKSVEFGDLFSADTWKKITGNDSLFNKINGSGIDFTSSAYIFGDGPRGSAQGYAAATFGVSDIDKLKLAIIDLKKATEIKEENGYSFYGDDKAIVIFNDKMGLFYTGDGGAAAIKTSAFALLATTEENSLIGTNDRFKDLMKKGDDIGVFMNYERVMDIAKSANPMMPTNFNTKDMAVTAGINFESGQVVTDYSIFSNKEMADKYKDMYKANVSSDVQAAHPGNAIAGLAVAMNMKSAVSMMKEMKLLDGADQNLEGMLGAGFNLDYFVATFSGDIVATANGLRSKAGMKYDWNTDQMVPSRDPAVDFAVTLGLADDAKAQGLIDLFVTKGMLTKLPDGSYSVMNKFYVVKSKGALTVAGEEAYGQVVAAKKAPKLDGRIQELFSSNAAAFVVDFSKIPADSLDVISPELKAYVKDMPLTSLEMYSPQPSGEVSTGKFLVNFKDKDKNALLSIKEMVQYSEKYFPKSPAPTAYADTTAVEVPVDSMAVPAEEMPQ